MKANTMSDQPIKLGYKRTEVGVIPEDWEVKTLEELGKWKGGGTPSMANPGYWQEGTIPWVSSGDVKHERLSSTEKSITKRAVQESSTTLLTEGALLIVTRSGILRKYLPVALNTVPVAINQDIKAVIPKRGVSSDYLLQALLRSGPIILASCMKAGTTVESIEFPWLKRFQVPIPTDPEEQQAIAEVLSDVDALLDALDRLIAKKRAIKQGAMQALLTGRVRLPGFTGEWKRCTLSEIGTFSKGSGIRKDDVIPDGLPCIRYGEIYTQHNDVIREYYSFIPPEVAATSRRLQKGELLFAGSGETAEEIGKCVAFIGDEEVYAGGDIVIFSPRKQDSVYLGYLMNYEAVTKQKASFAQGDAIVHISARNLGLVELCLPPLAEQHAIAKVLSDVDAEIEALEKRRSKLRAIKQGMMQELLTGRIRLVQPQASAQEDHV